MQVRKKIAISNKFIVITVLVLVVLICGALFLNTSPENGEAGSLTIKRGETVLLTLSMEELKELPKVDMEKTIVSGSSANETGIFTGVPLDVILNHTDECILKECTRFTMKAEDGYTAIVSLEDVEKENNVIIVYAKDGEPLPDSKHNGTGPIRAVIMQDEFGMRSIKYLLEITCQ